MQFRTYKFRRNAGKRILLKLGSHTNWSSSAFMLLKQDFSEFSALVKSWTPMRKSHLPRFWSRTQYCTEDLDNVSPRKEIMSLSNSSNLLQKVFRHSEHNSALLRNNAWNNKMTLTKGQFRCNTVTHAVYSKISRSPFTRLLPEIEKLYARLF